MGLLRAAFAGEAGSFAEDAAWAYFDRPLTMAVAGFREVFAAVTGQAAEAGVVPIENVSHGTVREVHDLLLEHPLIIVGEVEVSVRLCLAALPGQTIDDIERVYSHVQALAQAETFLRQRHWTLLASTNTAGAGKGIADRSERGAAVVLSPRAASLHGLTILARDIHTEPRNRTRFLILAAQAAPVWAQVGSGSGSMRTTLALSVRNEPGTLVQALGILAGHGLNVSKLESRPSRERDWEYVFWVDLDGDLCRPEGASVLSDLRAAALTVRLMGCYPRFEGSPAVN
ncbi:MAG: ACT domain-containing protein [Chloroflexota bacterium]|nr:ACT domain-containing protein [Chloroflexota bacterium]